MDEAPGEVSTAIDWDLQLWTSSKRIVKEVSMFNRTYSPGVIPSLRLLATVIGSIVKFSALVRLDVLSLWIPL